MDKTYCEVSGKPPFDWNKFLDDRLAGVPMKEGQHEHAYNLAAEWATCACGNQCAIIPRHMGIPEDEALRNRGLYFANDILMENWRGATLTLFLIEKRSAELIREELAKLNS